MTGNGVLVVDDSELIRRTLRGLLGRAGYEVRVAGSVADAWAEVSEWVPECVIVDHRLPDGDGLAFVGDLRAHPSFGAVRIVVLSGDPLPESAVTAADTFLLKPAHAEDVLAAVAGSAS